MSKRYEQLHYCEYRDIETGLVASNYVEVMNEQDQKIKELECRLANCIEPKFKIGQKVYMLYLTKVKITGYKIINFDKPYTLYRIKDGELTLGNIPENELFATKEEAKAKLEEIKNANN